MSFPHRGEGGPAVISSLIHNEGRGRSASFTFIQYFIWSKDLQSGAELLTVLDPEAAIEILSDVMSREGEETALELIKQMIGVNQRVAARVSGALGQPVSGGFSRSGTEKLREVWRDAQPWIHASSGAIAALPKTSANVRCTLSFHLLLNEKEWKRQARSRWRRHGRVVEIKRNK